MEGGHVKPFRHCYVRNDSASGIHLAASTLDRLEVSLIGGTPIATFNPYVLSMAGVTAGLLTAKRISVPKPGDVGTECMD